MWQPIDTAPRDGTDIWLISDEGQFQGAFYFDDSEKVFKCYPLSLDFFDSWDRCGDNPTPTHWMPLPKPPVKESLTTDYSADTSQNTEWE